MAYNMCGKRVGTWMTREAGAAARGFVTRCQNFDWHVWERGGYDGIGLGCSGMIGVESFDQSGHQLDETIMAAQGCTGRTFGQSVDDQIEGLMATLDRLSFKSLISEVIGSK